MSRENLRTPVRFGLVLLLVLAMIVIPAMAGTDNSSLPDASVTGAEPVLAGTASAPAVDQDAIHAKTLQLPLSFIENAGQAPDAVKYSVQAEGHTISFTPGKIVLIASAEKDNETVSSQVEMTFAGANTNPTITGLDQLPGTANYFTGSDSSQWHTDVPTYAGIQYTSLYPGIDLKYKGTLGNLKREFVVAPGADPSQIVMAYTGIDSLAISDDGSLKIATALGVLTDEAPVAYQEIEGDRVPVAVSYGIVGENKAGFVIGAYDPKYPLVIDPNLKYSTYLRGTGYSDYYGVTRDSAKNILVVGITMDNSYPTKDAYQPSLSGAGATDVVITKLSSDGSAILYSTYLGGSGGDYGLGIAIDPSNNMYVTGYTSSSNFPTKNALQGTSNGNEDAFITKLNASGNALVYSTYLGGSSSDYGSGIAADSDGKAYIVGATKSAGIPAIVNAAQSAKAGTARYYDQYVGKIAPDGSSYVYLTYLGGTLDEGGANFYIMGRIAVDSNGNAYVTGSTKSSTFPITTNPIQSTFGGVRDCFVTKYNSTGGMEYSTFLGGSDMEIGQGIAADSSGSVYVTGFTTSTNFPVTSGVFQPTIKGSGIQNGFLAKLNPSGQSLDYSTFYGGTSANDQGGYGVAVDAEGDTYITGSTFATDFPVKNAFQPLDKSSTTGTEGYVFKMNPTGSGLLWASYLGGSSGDSPYGIAYDGRGNVTVVGSTSSADFTVTANALNTTLNGEKNGFISIISETPTANFTATPVSGNAPFTVQFTDTSSDNPTTWLWGFGDGTTSTDQNPSHTFSTVRKYDITLTATNAFGSGTVTKTGFIQGFADAPPLTSFTANKTVGKFPLTVQFTDTSLNAPTSWLWDFGDGGTSTLQNPVYTFPSPGTYMVSLNASNSFGFNQSTQTNMIQVIDTDSTPLPTYRGINIRVANDEGVKYNVSDGVVADNTAGITYTFVPNTYFVSFRSDSGGLNPLHISTSPSTTSGQLTTTTNQSGTFYLTFTGGQPTMPDGILMLGVNGSIPDDFAIHVRTSGYNWTLSSPSISNTPTLPTTYNYVDGAVDQTFNKSDFIYGPQTWKPYAAANYPIYYGQDMSNTADTFRIMFIDTRVGALQNTALTDGGMIKVEYSFTNLTSNAVFNDFGWYSNSNHGTGIIMTNDVTTGGTSSSGYTVTPVITPVVIAPVASFSANATTGTAPLAVTFTDTSSNTPTAWAWDFNNDGTIDATTQNATYTFTAAGTYTVNLTATNAAGSNTSLQAGYITVSASAVAPVASFTSDMKTGSAPLTVQFNDTSSGDGITGYQWILGDSATIYTTQNLSHAFTTAGTYSVNHSVTNAAGMNWKNETGYVVVTPRVAKTWTVCQDSSSGCDFVTTNFTEVLKYPSFNDGDTIYLYNGTYSYPTYTTNSRMLTITGEDPSAVIIDMPVSFYFTNTVNISKIYFRSSHDSTYTGFTLSGANSVVRDCIFDSTGRFVITKATNILIENNTVENVGFYAAGIGGTDYKTFRNNSFANLSGDTGINIGKGSNHLIEGNRFWDYGSYGIAITSGLSNITIRRNNFLHGPSLKLATTSTNHYIYQNNFITINNIVNNGDPINYLWSSTSLLSYTYAGSGNTGYLGNYWGSRYTGTDTNGDGIGETPYTFILGSTTQTDSAPLMDRYEYYFGKTHTATTAVFVSPQNATVNTTQTRQFAATATDTEGMINPSLTYAWTSSNLTVGTITPSTGLFTGLVPGNTTITATTGGISNTSAVTVVTNPVVPVANFTADKTTGAIPLAVHFTDQSTNTPTSWLWNFGDLGTSTEQNPDHTYTAAGTYTVSLTATNAAGSNQTVKTDYLVVSGAAAVTPVASFTAGTTSGVAPLTVKFTDASTNTPVAWLWDFGDGSISTDASPSHTYATAGIFTVNLTATNTGGSNSSVKTNYITATGVVPGYTGVFVSAANDEGIRWDYHGNNTLYINTNGGGLNAVHISTNPTVYSGQVTTTPDKSGTFYFTDTGGRSYQDEGILMIAVNGTLPDDFAVHIRTSGYTWIPNTTTTGVPPPEGTYTYQAAALDQTFTKSDFIYGPQNWRPQGNNAAFPIYNGEDLGNTADNQYHIAFIDTRAGLLGNRNGQYLTTINNGSVKVEYSFTNLTNNAAFNLYAWNLNPKANSEGMGWTNDVTTSGYFVKGLPAAPVVIAPVASFGANTTTGTAPLTVTFNDTSSNTPTSWAWDFNNDGTIDATTQNATYTYTAAGTYTVNLTATNAAGSNSLVRNKYISVQEAPADRARLILPAASLYQNTATQLPVQVMNITNGTGISFDLAYDPSVIRVNEITLNQSYASGSNLVINQTDGRIRLALTRTDGINIGSPVPVFFINTTGTGAVGLSTPLTLTNARWGDGTFNYRTFNTMNGSALVYRYRGDLNGNTEVDIGDTAKTAYMVVEKTPHLIPDADFNNNGRIDVGDASKIAWYLVGKITEL